MSITSASLGLSPFMIPFFLWDNFLRQQWFRILLIIKFCSPGLSTSPTLLLLFHLFFPSCTHLDLLALDPHIVLVGAGPPLRDWFPLPLDVVAADEAIEVGVLLVIAASKVVVVRCVILVLCGLIVVMLLREL